MSQDYSIMRCGIRAECAKQANKIVHLREALREVVACSVALGNGEVMVKLEESFIERLRRLAGEKE